MKCSQCQSAIGRYYKTTPRHWDHLRYVLKIRIVVGGSHGKTTITAMILHVLAKQNIDTDYMVGAQLAGFNTMVKLTKELREYFQKQGSIGGKKAAKTMDEQAKRNRAKKAAAARWGKKKP